MTIFIDVGTYGNFEIMPLLCPHGFDTCTTTLDTRERLRKKNTDGLSSTIYPIPFMTDGMVAQMLRLDISL